MNKFASNTMFGFRWLTWLAAVLLPTLAQAHPGLPGHSHGLANGLAHPLTGLDHLCAMVAVGIWAAQRGGRALWFVPSVFMSVMILGATLGMGAVPVPFVESGVVASVLVLAALIVAKVRLPLTVSALLVGVFALFHGYAHGAEMPVSASGLIYGLGFVSATAGLHLLGIGLGLLAQRLSQAMWIQCVGATITAFGIYLCISL